MEHVLTRLGKRRFAMLEHVPAWLGHLIRDHRAGHEKLVAADPGIRLDDASIELGSPAFSPGGRLPIRFTADGEGVSPPLVWGEVPERTASLALIVEDPDAPALKPLVHAIVWDMPPDERRIAEGTIVANGAGGDDGDVGRNSFLREGWLPPDPPTGHGEHDYVFQLFALSETPELGASPGRGAFVDAIAGRVLAAGVLIGTYSRGEPAESGGATNIAIAGDPAVN
jgi:Raf kinase inhibitor-like YbhB/YbcL family protein